MDFRQSLLSGAFRPSTNLDFRPFQPSQTMFQQNIMDVARSLSAQAAIANGNYLAGAQAQPFKGAADGEDDAPLIPWESPLTLKAQNLRENLARTQPYNEIAGLRHGQFGGMGLGADAYSGPSIGSAPVSEQPELPPEMRRMMNAWMGTNPPFSPDTNPVHAQVASDVSAMLAGAFAPKGPQWPSQ